MATEGWAREAAGRSEAARAEACFDGAARAVGALATEEGVRVSVFLAAAERAAGVTAAEGLGELVGVGEVGLGVVATPTVVKGVAATSAKGARAATLAEALAEESRTAARMEFAAAEAKEVAGGYAEAMMM